MSKKTALLSVFDKTGLVDFATELLRLDFRLISTGGTARLLREHKIPVTDVSEITGFPEIMDGRVKTLHPLIHGGILCRQSNPADRRQAKENNIERIDLLCVNLYPFESVAADPNSSREDIIEHIDIGGPAMLRASAKNHQDVVVICNPADYNGVIQEFQNHGDVRDAMRRKLAVAVFQLTARYDAAIARTLGNRLLNKNSVTLNAYDGETLRYGENPHQRAEIYRFQFPGESVHSLADVEVLSGKSMSYNNYQDLDAGIQTVSAASRTTPTVAVMKHNNPCGFSGGSSVEEALERAWEGDPISAFGSVIVSNVPFTLAAAEYLKSPNIVHVTYQVIDGEYIPRPAPMGKFVEIIAAPDFELDAVEFLQSKSKTLRLVRYPICPPTPGKTVRFLNGALLIQDKNIALCDDIVVKTRAGFPFDLRPIAEFGINVNGRLLSNSISIVREYAPGLYQLMGMGAGQPNRIDSIRKLAIPKTVENLQRDYLKLAITEPFDAWLKKQMGLMVLISDAFFPFDDSVREAASLGINYILQPGGSNRDADSVKACDELGVAMGFTGIRHFKH